MPADRGPLTVAGSRWHSGRLLVRFAGYEDRTAAEELRDTVLTIDSEDLAPLDDPEEFYDHDLIGLQVATVAGEPVGAVTDVLHDAQTLLVIEGSGPRSGLRSWCRSSRRSCPRWTWPGAAWSSTRLRA